MSNSNVEYKWSESMSGYKELITDHRLVEALDLSVETVWRYTREKKIPYVELCSKQYRYKLTDVMRALTGSTVQEKERDYKAEVNGNTASYCMSMEVAH